MRAISDAIADALREAGDKPLGVEGYEDGSWILIDANDVIVHVFRGDTRKHYDLERLWSDAPAIPVAEASDLAAADGSEQAAP